MAVATTYRLLDLCAVCDTLILDIEVSRLARNNAQCRLTSPFVGRVRVR